MSSMNERYSANEYLRMMNIISLLQEIDEGMSVDELADKFQLPAEVVIEDLYHIHKTAQLRMYITPADLDTDDENFLADLFAGMKNNGKIVLIDEQHPDTTEQISVQMTKFESMVLGEFLQKYYPAYIPIQEEIRTKKVVHAFTKEQMKYMQSIQLAIAEKRMLKLTYMTKEKELLQFQCMPIKLVKLLSDELVYLISVFDNQQMYYRLDRIKQLEMMSEKYDISEHISHEIIKEFDYRWGMGPYEEPFHFSMQVFDEVNLPARLQKELAERKYGTWLKHVDGSYLYQDWVIDYDALKRGVLSLGSSVKVLEPKRLALDIKASAKKRMELYEEKYANKIYSDAKIIPQSEI